MHKACLVSLECLRQRLISVVSDRVVVQAQSDQSLVCLECLRERLSSVVSNRIGLQVQSGQSCLS